MMYEKKIKMTKYGDTVTICINNIVRFFIYIFIMAYIILNMNMINLILCKMSLCDWAAKS